MCLWSFFRVCEFQTSGYSGRYGITGSKVSGKERCGQATGRKDGFAGWEYCGAILYVLLPVEVTDT
jgi:hypothetical protein